MFEKEAECYAFDEVNHKQEWYIKHPEHSIDCDYEDIKKHWGKGAEFGYNKANEWHYMKDGLPKDNEYVLIYTDLNNCYVATKVENHFMSKGWGFIPMSTVIAWKEIVLPELKGE